MSLDDDVTALADLAGFRGDGVGGTGVSAREVVVVQLVLGSHDPINSVVSNIKSSTTRVNNDSIGNKYA